MKIRFTMYKAISNLNAKPRFYDVVCLNQFVYSFPKCVLLRQIIEFQAFVCLFCFVKVVAERKVTFDLSSSKCLYSSCNFV